MSLRNHFHWLFNDRHKKDHFEFDMDEELRFHIESQIEDCIEAGMSPEEARRKVLLAFGGMDKTVEECRDTRWTRYLDEFRQDLCYALRGFRNSPGFALTVICTLALGLGVLATSFTVFNAFVMRPFAVRDPHSLYALIGWSSSSDEGGPGKWTLTWHEFRNLRRDNPAFSEVIGYQPCSLWSRNEGRSWESALHWEQEKRASLAWCSDSPCVLLLEALCSAPWLPWRLRGYCRTLSRRWTSLTPAVMRSAFFW